MTRIKTASEVKMLTLSQWKTYMSESENWMGNFMLNEEQNQIPSKPKRWNALTEHLLTRAIG